MILWKSHVISDFKTKVFFTKPDILFLIFAFRYRGEALAALQGYRTLVVDEFHLYQGVEFATLCLWSIWRDTWECLEGWCFSAPLPIPR